MSGITPLMTLTIGSHFFKVNHLTTRAREAVVQFAQKYVKYGFKQVRRGREVSYIKVAEAVYGTATNDREEYRFHINQLSEFKTILERNYINDNLIEIVYKNKFEALSVNLKMKPEWIPRDYQLPAIDYLDDPGPPLAKFIGIQTGKGKSFLSIQAAVNYGKRLAVVVRPMFMDKWVLDLQNYLDIDPNRIMSVQGGAELQALLELQRTGRLDDIDIILFSNKTIQLWLGKYQKYKELLLDQGYACLPEDMYEYLGCGNRLIDEVHLDFHLNFKMDLYTNISKSISLSATLENKDPFMLKMYEIAYPAAMRFKAMAIDKYAIARCVMYNLQNDRKIKTIENGGNNYSHNAYEESIMKDDDFLQSYMNLIKYTVDISYMKDYVKGERAIIFAYKTEMCTIIVDFLKKQYPDLDIRRYVSEDPQENMDEPDIRVTTLGSGSTAHDIARLKTAILTVNVDSLQSNIQAFGRLRKIDGLTPKFYYLTCADIPKHMQYHESKVILMQERALNFNYIQPPFQV